MGFQKNTHLFFSHSQLQELCNPCLGASNILLVAWSIRLPIVKPKAVKSLTDFMFWSTYVWARDKNCKAGYMFCKAYSVFIALITLNKLVEKKRFQTELWLLQLNWMMPFCTSPLLPLYRTATLCIQSMRWSPLHPIIVHSMYYIVSYCIDLSYLIIFHSSYLQWGWVDLFCPL